MKTENKVPEPHKLRTHRPIKAKAAAVRPWSPHPSSLTREEIRKLVIEQIG